MAERTYTIANGPAPGSAAITSQPTGTALRTMMQIQAHPLGPPLRIVEWGASFDSFTAATPGKVELIETGTVGASGGNPTTYKVPMTFVTTAISSGGTTTLVVSSAANFPGAGDYSIKAVVPFGLGTVGQERMLVTAGQGTTSWTVTRAIDGDTALASIPIGSIVVGELGRFETDIPPQNNGLWLPPSSVVWSNSGFATAAPTEGTIPASARYLAPPQLIAPTNQDIMPFPLGREPEVQPGCFARIRMTFGTSVNAYCYIVVAE